MSKFTTITLPSGMVLDVIDGTAIHMFIAMNRLNNSDEKIKECGILPFMIQQLCLKDGQQMTIDYILNLSINDSLYITTVLNIQLEKLNL